AAEPTWSPHGPKIAFTSQLGDGTLEIYTMNADGTGQTNITNNAVDDYGPDWGPADTTPPDTSIDSGPSNPTAATSASFSFSSTEAGSTFECKLDAGSFASCSSPKSYS